MKSIYAHAACLLGGMLLLTDQLLAAGVKW